MTDFKIREIAKKILNQDAFTEIIVTTYQWQDCFDAIVKVLKGENNGQF